MSNLGLRPSIQNGFSKNPTESKFPVKWRGLVGNWSPMMGRQGRSLRDFSLKRLDGDFTNLPSNPYGFDSGGFFLDFDGVDDYVLIPKNDHIGGLTNNFTISVLARPESLSGTRRFIASSRQLVNSGIAFGTNGNDLKFTSFGVKDYNFPTTIILGELVHTAVFLDSNNDANFYINGKYQGTVTGTSPAKTSKTDTLQLGTALNFSGPSEKFKGGLYDVKIFNTGLDSESIMGLYQDVLALFRNRHQQRLFVGAGSPSSFNPALALGPESVIGGPVFA